MKSFLVALRQLGFNTTIHGCRHLVEDGRHWIERVIWVCVLGAAAAGVTKSCMDVYSEYMSTPTVTSLESTQYPAWNVPFPAVGICNVNKISYKKARELSEELAVLNNYQYSSTEILALLKRLGDIYGGEPYKGDLTVFTQVLAKFNASVTEILARMAPSCDSLFLRCRWKGRVRACRQLFKTVATSYGFCCVFNMLPADFDESDVDSLPEALQAAGHRSGLSVIVDPETEDYFYPVVPTYGVQVIFFPPKNRPESSNGMMEYVANSGNELFYTIDVFSQFSTAELSYFTPEERGCFYRKERDARYTSANCLAGCMRQLILETCHCLPYYMSNSSNSKVCHVADIGCLASAKVRFQEYLKADAERDIEKGDAPSPPSPCGMCLPACSSTWYEVQSSYAKIDTRGKDSIKKLDNVVIHENVSALHIYYASLDTTLYKQDVIYTRTELVSNFGGICSLFSGFSFLSLVEIVYFLTIRLFYIRREKKDPQRNEMSEHQGDAPPPPATPPLQPAPEALAQPAPYWGEFRVKSNDHWTHHIHPTGFYWTAHK